MRVLSIDLPWSAASGRFGFAWTDTNVVPLSIYTSVVVNAANKAKDVFESFAAESGKFDIVLLDQPIGGCQPNRTGCRDVERVFGNSSFVMNGTIKIQSPRFQPGTPYAHLGLRNAELIINFLGTSICVVVESFPQLSIPPLIFFAKTQNAPSDAIIKLGQHKTRGALGLAAANQLLNLFSIWTNTAIHGPALHGDPDALDALLALLPALEVYAPSKIATAAPIWLHGQAPPEALYPSAVPAKIRSNARSAWMSLLNPHEIGPPGIRSDGILGLTLPGWPIPTGANRSL